MRNGQAIASMAMAVLTGVALLCYVGTLALASAAQREAGRQAERQAERGVQRQGQRPVPRQVPRQAADSWFARE